MSSNDQSKLREQAEQPKQPVDQRPKLDKRVRRTHERLGSALLTLILEKPMSEVTVQEVLDRASVGRSTFYLHFRDKDDLLLSQLEYFLETMSTALSVRKEESHRVVAVAELFGHILEAKMLYRTLGEIGFLSEFFELAQGYFTRGIEQRLIHSRRLANLPQRELDARASALAGSMLSLLRWWLDRGGQESPNAMDELFHRIVWHGVA